MKRVLTTGQRSGQLLVIQEIQKPNRGKQYSVIVYCFACKEPKRMLKHSAQRSKTCGCMRMQNVSETIRQMDERRSAIRAAKHADPKYVWGSKD